MQNQVRLSNRQMQNESYLVSSVEEGIRMIRNGSPKAVLGGRETLYFNMKRHGKLIMNTEYLLFVTCFLEYSSFFTIFNVRCSIAGTPKFQISEKLYTRYSAVAVQLGCPYLDSLNDVYVQFVYKIVNS